MFRLTAFPAQDGDCLLLSYGEDADHAHHVLVDGGRTGTYVALRPTLAEIGKRGGRLELLVLSHIDADHIEGLLKLAGDPALPLDINKVWFNGFDQMGRLRAMGPGQGDQFSDAIRQRPWLWNSEFHGHAACLSAAGAPLPVTLDGDLKLTLLSPDLAKLRVMRDEWKDWRDIKATERAEAERVKATPGGLQIMGRRPMPSPLDVEALAKADEQSDDEPPNGSSIAFVAEWRDKRILFAADAHPDLLIDSLRQLIGKEPDRYRLDLFKVSHHGSIRNTSRALLELLECQAFLLSTNGSRHGHPDPETIARILKYSQNGPKALYFNYRQPYTTPWNQQALKGPYDYACCFPSGAAGHLVIDL